MSNEIEQKNKCEGEYHPNIEYQCSICKKRMWFDVLERRWKHIE